MFGIQASAVMIFVADGVVVGLFSDIKGVGGGSITDGDNWLMWFLQHFLKDMDIWGNLLVLFLGMLNWYV